MHFLRLFTGSFFSANLYRELRYGTQGYGLRYSMQLLVLTTFIVGLCLSVQGKLHLFATGAASGIGLIIIVTLALRFIMLFALAVAVRFMALALKPALGYDAALRLTAVAYTPMALMDAAAFSLHGMTLNPFLLFGCGLAMLLAALIATR